MESLLSFFGCIGTMNRSVGTPLVWSPPPSAVRLLPPESEAGLLRRTGAFRRFGPAKAGTPNGWFMESVLSLFRMHYDHEPRAVARPTESPDKSDALQTLRAVRRRQSVAKRLECVRLQRRFPQAGCESMAESVHRKPPRPCDRPLRP